MMPVVDSNVELNQQLDRWAKEFRSNNSNPPLEILQRISELLEKETEAYYRTDPDPFDDRHPIRTRPDSALGTLLKNLFRDDDFLTRLITSYLLHRDNVELQTLSCRLLYVMLPGMEASTMFSENDSIIPRLYQWAETAEEPLRSYATGILGSAMTVADTAVMFKDDNMRLVPIMLRRLKELSCIQEDQNESNIAKNNVLSLDNGNESILSTTLLPPHPTSGDQLSFGPFQMENKSSLNNGCDISRSSLKRENPDDDETNLDSSCLVKEHPIKRRKEMNLSSSLNSNFHTSNSNHSNRHLLSPPHLNSECSNSSWAELEPYMIGTFRMFPLSVAMQQRFILQYLTPMGDYSELLCHVFENDALQLICHYIDLKKNSDIRLSFDALRYLASLLCHKKFVLEFLRIGGLQLLLQVYRPSVAATGVSLCFYYLAYNEDAMENICLQPKSVLNDLVTYALWLLECSHSSSRCHSANFFAVSFAFRNILELFDAQDGLRKLLNVMFMLDLFADETSLSDEELLLKQQLTRHVCVALRKYFETHLLIECEQLRRFAIAKHHHLANNEHIMQCINKLNIGNIPSYKAIKYTSENIAEFLEALLELMPLRKSWKPVEELIKLGGVKLLINIIYIAVDWAFSGKVECIKCALDILVVGSASPKLQAALIEELVLEMGDSTTMKTSAIRIILEAADGMLSDPDIQCSALQVLINCCCSPLHRIGSSSIRLFQNPLPPPPLAISNGGASSTPSSVNVQSPTVLPQPKIPVPLSSGTKRHRAYKSGEDLLHRMWDAVRSSNGILILLNLLSVKVPLTHADKIRCLACKTLCGLARNEKIKQILSKLPMFTTGELQQLMKEPIVHERRLDYLQFTRHCIKLIEMVTGTPMNQQLESISPAYFNRAEVVAQTKITYNQKELLQLIHQHLEKQGFTRTAKLLLEEANQASNTQSNPLTWPSNTPPSKQSFSSSRKRVNKRRPYLINDCTTSPSTLSLRTSREKSVNKSLEKVESPVRTHPLANGIGTKTTIQMPHSGFTPIRPSLATPLRSTNSMLAEAPSNGIQLDNIVTEYLRKQHSLCTHPVYTCPPFDLFQPHRCPAPSNRGLAPLNCVRRFAQRQIKPRFGGMQGAKYERQFIYSKFRPIRTFRETEGATSVTSCAFSQTQDFLFLGTYSGDLILYNLNNCTLETSYQCHESEITKVEPSKDGRLVLTCSQWRRPMASLWTFTELFDLKMNFGEDPYVEFAKQTSNRAIGTKETAAHLYDLSTGVCIQTYADERLSNGYAKNRATLNYTDELLLNDGVLWDVRSSVYVHKFDKLTSRDLNGVFHPNGWQIVANSEVWDLRTYRLLHTVPALDQCHIKFNQTGDVIYGAMFEDDLDSDDEVPTRSPYCSSILTFDAHDYSNITVFDVKRVIYDLSVDTKDIHLAVVENLHFTSHPQQMFNTESVCKLYEIGRCKEDGEDDDDEESEDDNVDDGDDDDDEEDDEESDQDLDNRNFDLDFISVQTSSDSETYELSSSSDGDDDDEAEGDTEDDEDEDDEDMSADTDEDAELDYELVTLGNSVDDVVPENVDEDDATWDPNNA